MFTCPHYRIPYEELIRFFNMVENESNISQKSKNHLGKIGLLVMVIGLAIVYYDSFRLIQTIPTGYQFYEHPEIHIPIIGMIIAFSGTGLFIYNFIKGRNVI